MPSLHVSLMVLDSPWDVPCMNTHSHSLTHIDTHAQTHSLRRTHTHPNTQAHTHIYPRSHTHSLILFQWEDCGLLEWLVTWLHKNSSFSGLVGTISINLQAQLYLFYSNFMPCGEIFRAITQLRNWTIWLDKTNYSHYWTTVVIIKLLEAETKALHSNWIIWISLDREICKGRSKP